MRERSYPQSDAIGLPVRPPMGLPDTLDHPASTGDQVQLERLATQDLAGHYFQVLLALQSRGVEVVAATAPQRQSLLEDEAKVLSTQTPGASAYGDEPRRVAWGSSDTDAETSTGGFAETAALIPLLERTDAVLSTGQAEDLRPGEEGPFWRELDELFRSVGSTAIELLFLRLWQPAFDEGLIAYFAEWLSLLEHRASYGARCHMLRQLLGHHSAAVRLAAASGLEWLACPAAAPAISAAADREPIQQVREVLQRIADNLRDNV